MVRRIYQRRLPRGIESASGNVASRPRYPELKKLLSQRSICQSGTLAAAILWKRTRTTGGLSVTNCRGLPAPNVGLLAYPRLFVFLFFAAELHASTHAEIRESLFHDLRRPGNRRSPISQEAPASLVITTSFQRGLSMVPGGGVEPPRGVNLGGF